MSKEVVKNDAVHYGRKANNTPEPDFIVNDSWANIYTRQGVEGFDKATGFTHKKGPIMREQQLKSIYREDGFAKKIVNRPTDDMVREWFTVAGDTDGLINKALMDICAPKEIRKALRWAKVFGGALVVMGIDDGNISDDRMEEAVNEEKIQSIEFLEVYDRYRVTWEDDDLDEDTNSKNFGLPLVYKITPVSSDVQEFRVHYSRVLRFDGELTDETTRRENDNWDDSVYTGIRRQLINLNSSYEDAKSVIDEYVMTIIKIDGLQQMLGAGNSDLVKERMNIIDLGRHTINSVILDANEDFDRSSSSVAGIDKLLQEFQIGLAAVTDIPLVILMGRSPGGMSATGDADIRLYYDTIHSAQNADMRAQMLILVKYMMLSKDGPFGAEIKDWTIEFNPLWQPTEKEAADTRKIQSETDEKYINLGVLSNIEVRDSRFGGDEYSAETKIDSGTTNQLKQILPPTLEPTTEKKSVNVDNIASFGKSSEAKDHTHELFFDTITGNGFTGGAGEENHVHRIESFQIQPRQDQDGTLHLHIISKDILERLFNDAK